MVSPQAPFPLVSVPGQTTAPSGLAATLAEEEFESDEEFCWEGDDSGLY